MKKLIAIIIAIFMAASLVATCLYSRFNPDLPAETRTTVSSKASAEATDTVVYKEMDEKSILLVDCSGSTAGVITATADYDEIVNFSSDVGIKGSWSHIDEAIQWALDSGYTRIGIITDCQEYRSDGSTDWRLMGAFDDVEIRIFLTEDYDIQDVANGVEAIEAVMTKSSSTLEVWTAEHELLEQFGFQNRDTEVSSSVSTPVTVETQVETTTKEGNSVPLSLAIWLAEIFFLIFCIMALLLLALAGCRNEASPLDEAIKDSEVLGLDGSASVSRDYQSFLQYAKKHRGKPMLRFADTVEQVSLKEAISLSPSGNTAGYAFLREAYEKGYKTILCLTDGGFNDDPSIAEGVIFEKIYLVGSNPQVEKLRGFAKDIEIVHI